jgi:hypothetical protein
MVQPIADFLTNYSAALNWRSQNCSSGQIEAKAMPNIRPAILGTTLGTNWEQNTPEHHKTRGIKHELNH